jgi:hypothetical protein
MALPATGSQISMNQIQVYYGFPSLSTRTMSQLGTQVGTAYLIEAVKNLKAELDHLKNY